jgi:hypothetical protein
LTGCSISCRDFLLKCLQETPNEVTQHGAALGLGIAGLGAQDDVIFEELKNVLFTDSAVAGEVRTSPACPGHPRGWPQQVPLIGGTSCTLSRGSQ